MKTCTAGPALADARHPASQAEVNAAAADAVQPLKASQRTRAPIKAVQSVRHLLLAVPPQVLFAALMTGIALTVGIAASSFWLPFAALRELAIMAGTDQN
mgnify:CR=1 FL=1